MRYIPIDSVKEGVVLSDDVHDINGRLLLSKGQQIKSGHIRILKIWGVPEIKVIGDEAASSDAVEFDSEQMEHVEASIRKLFLNIDIDRPAGKTAFQSIVAYRCEHNPALPCEDVVPAIESAADVSFRDIQQKIKNGRIKLPEMPAIVIELNKVLDDPHASANDVARIVSSSTSLASLVLKICNSAAFGLPVKVDSIVRAVSLLGGREISSLAISISVMRAFRDIPSKLIDMPSFFIHSLSCATLTRIIAALANIGNPEKLFVAGLLHDVGKLILFKYFPEQSASMLRQLHSEGNRRSLLEIERAETGTTHGRIAKLLLNKWNFPDRLQNNIVHHHQPSRAEAPAEAAIVQLADIITHGMGSGNSGERILPGFDQEAWEQVGIAHNTIKMAIRQASHQLNTIRTIFG
jgi:putative nucleotidyltransferase with HDIG domain